MVSRGSNGELLEKILPRIRGQGVQELLFLHYTWSVYACIHAFLGYYAAMLPI